MAERRIFNRIVLGLPYHRPDHNMRLAAEMARLLQLDLFGLFVEEESLFSLASLPFAREFKFLGGGWCPFDIKQLSRDLGAAAKSAERTFADTAKTLQTTCQFEVVRGSMADTIASTARATDIILLAEPESPAECASQQSVAIFDAAFHSAAAVLLVPGRIARRSGAIVAIASGPGDPSIEVAKAIAAAAKEELIVLEKFKSTDKVQVSTTNPSMGMRVRQIPVGEGGLRNTSEIWSALGQVRERLVVMTRSDECGPSSIASMRHVPILILEPSRDKIESGHSVCPAA